MGGGCPCGGRGAAARGCGGGCGGIDSATGRLRSRRGGRSAGAAFVPSTPAVVRSIRGRRGDEESAAGDNGLGGGGDRSEGTAPMAAGERRKGAAAPSADSTPPLSAGEGAVPGRAPAPAKPLSRWGSFPCGLGDGGGGRRKAGAAPAAVGLGLGGGGVGRSPDVAVGSAPSEPPARPPACARAVSLGRLNSVRLGGAGLPRRRAALIGWRRAERGNATWGGRGWGRVRPFGAAGWRGGEGER